MAKTSDRVLCQGSIAKSRQQRRLFCLSVPTSGLCSRLLDVAPCLIDEND